MDNHCNTDCESSCGFTRCLHRIGEFLQSFLLLALRLYFGYLLFQTGSGKIADIAKTTAFFESLHIPVANLASYLVGYTEMIGGLCLMAGFLSRWITIPLIIVLTTAMLTAHKGQVVHEAGPFPFLLTCLVVFCFGAGYFSLDWLIGRFCCKK